MPKWRKTHEVRAELADLVDEAEAINTLAQDSELTDDQEVRWNELTNKTEGLIQSKQAELKSREEVDEQKQALALARAQSNPAAIVDEIETKSDQGQPRLKSPAPLKAFKGPNAMQDAYDCGQWMKALVARGRGGRDDQAESVVARRGWGNFSNATEGSDAAGGHTVPDPLTAAFVEFRQASGVARKLCSVLQMDAETLKVPKLTSGPTVKYPGEATATVASDQVWGSYTLTAVERSILTKVSNPLRADSAINFVDNVISRMAYELALQEDNEFVNGDASDTYGDETGLLEALGAAGKSTMSSGNTNWTAVNMGALTGLMGILPSKHRGNPSWLCSSAFYHTVLLDLLQAGGGNAIAALEGGGSAQPSFLGYPVHLTDFMPTATAVSTTSVLFGTFSDGCTIGDRTSLEVLTSEHRYFEERSLGVLGTTRYDINIHEGGDSSDAGAYVGLVTAAS